MIKTGGIISCFQAESGKLLYREKLGGSGMYFASPIAANGRIYIASLKGIVTVFEAGAEGEGSKKIVFTGDILCPLLRKADYRYLQEADYLFTDANNRFPYPSSNHWSISPDAPDGSGESGFLRAFREKISCTHLIAPHIPVARDPEIHAYFDEFLAYCDERIPLSVFEFVERINPGKVCLVHYGGMEDRNHHGESLLNPVQLENWTNAKAELKGLASSFLVPRPGDIYEIA